MAETEKFDVFLSHNSRDKDSIRIIAHQLEQGGFITWFDEDQFKGGIVWQKKLYKALDKTNLAFFFIGTNGVGPWQEEEIDYLHNRYISSRKKNISIIPIFLPGAGIKDVPRDLNYLNKFQFIFLLNLDDYSEISKLLEIFSTFGIVPNKRKKKPKKDDDPTPKKTHPCGYIRLERLLNQGKWKEADEETITCMVKVSEQKGTGRWLNFKHIENFPYTDLCTIDNLWAENSKGKFGFSVQKEIHQISMSKTKNNKQGWKLFCSRVGWQRADMETESNLTGHFPRKVWQRIRLSTVATVEPPFLDLYTVISLIISSIVSLGSAIILANILDAGNHFHPSYVLCFLLWWGIMIYRGVSRQRFEAKMIVFQTLLSKVR
ncbi:MULTISPECIES: GUN4 domain-containing protein [Okeania]|uniref:TIR domain-containing protein n=1 Tax=Okeania hirsuta TaxID=1458930 RepID=A0A3N6Q200_9CYAN|nr:MULTISPECIES: GUN4 domain-containing protein [Okeania]NES89679.1 TIR domain-containing protein [Okeania sp. SIO2B9]NET74831.1 TIR domain-containing protein [Okeania sp. SIO1F9]RQH54548.1 TIR domain-containing protein [Okeania hirsuta]